MLDDGQPTYVAVCKATRQMAIVNLPERLMPFADRLIEHLTHEYYGEPVDDELVYCMNWSARQWVAQALDDYQLWGIP